MKKLQCFKIKIIGLLISVFSSSSAIATENVEGPLACDFSAEESRMVTLKITNGDIEGAVMRLPRDYIIGVSYSENSVNDTGQFRVYNDDFNAYPNRELHLKDGRYKGAVGIHDELSILISSNWRPPKLALRNISLLYNLGFESPDADLQGELSTFGLYSPRHKISPIYKKEVFLGKQNNEITDVISCSEKNKPTGIPQCKHFFEARAYDVQLGYPRTQLDRWKEFRNNTNKLLQCFTVQEPRQVKGK